MTTGAGLKRRLREVSADLVRPIAGATLFVFVVQFVTTGVYTVGAALAFLVLDSVLVALSLVVGRWIGRRLWPRHGLALTRRLLRGYAKTHERGDLLLTGRSEFVQSMRRRIFEATALIAGLNLLLVFAVAPFLPVTGRVATGILPLVLTIYLTVALVPHWTFARLGLRRVDHARFMVSPLTREYSDRLRISNGAVVLLALGIGGFVLRQQGATDVQAGQQIVSSGLTIVLLSVILVATAVAFYQREETGVVEAAAREAIAMGFRDGRGESEGELAAKLTRKPS